MVISIPLNERRIALASGGVGWHFSLRLKGDTMAFWDADMATRMGAESAAHTGGLSSYIYGGFSAFSLGILYL